MNLIIERSFAKVLLRFGYNMFQVKDATPLIDLLPMLVKNRMERIRSGSFSFLQIGANDGFFNDPIRAIIDRFPGWKWEGILVEPNPKIFGSLQGNYKGYEGLSFEQVAITDENKPITLYVSDGLADESVLSSLSRSAAALSLGAKKSRIKEVSVPGCTLSTLFAKHNTTNLDLFITNTEGLDHDIMVQLFSKTHVCPHIIRFEHSLMRRADYAECCELLKIHGYALLQVGTNTLAQRV
jgi:FkbM family methyltransferase